MRKRIGEFLLEKGAITQHQVGHILRHSQETGLRFGDAAMDLGFLSREQMAQVFGSTSAVDFFYLEPGYFPKVTQELLPPDALVRLGLLPLGYKTEYKFFRARKVLNLGMLDPSHKEASEEAKRLAISKLGEGGIQGVKIFLVLADQFLAVLSNVYGIKEAELKSKEPGQVDGTLSMFLDHVR